MGEDRVVAALTKNLRLSKEVKTGAGDDCAVVVCAGSGSNWELLKTDSLIETIHFTPETDPRKVGWKAMARAISDIAAMGGAPKHAMITIALSPSTEFARVKAIYAGIQKAANAFDVSIVGGETARSPGPLFLSVALTGVVAKASCILRSGGRPGDLLYVTGRLGGSIRGKHLNFLPRLKEGQWLAKHFRPNAMMDLSDGLGADLPRLAAASNTGFEIIPESLPLSHGCTPQDAMKDGEDFELLFAIGPRKVARLEAAWKKQFPKLALTRIGKLTPKVGAKISQTKHPYGFDHFA